MTETVKTLVENCLSRAGFTAAEDYSECGAERYGMKYLAYYRVKEISLGNVMNGTTPVCDADITFDIRLFGAKRGFYDRKELSEKAEKFISELIFSSTVIVGRLVCGEAVKNMQLGRLEYHITATLRRTVKRGG